MTIKSAANPNPVLIKHYLKLLLKGLEEKKAGEVAPPPVSEPKQEKE